MTDQLAARKFFVAAPIAAAGLHIFTVLAAGFQTPDYSQAEMAISDLGRQGQMYAFPLNYFGLAVPGLLILIAALSARRVLPSSKTLRIGLCFTASAGLSLVIAGFYQFPSLTHLAFALLAEVSAACAIFILSIYVRQLGRFSALAACGTIISMLDASDAIIWVFAQGAHIRLHPFLGLEQRAATFSAFIWIGSFTAALGKVGLKTFQK